MSGEPTWYEMIPEAMRPTKEAKEDLESIREEYDFPDEAFFMAVLSSEEMTRKAQYVAYRNLRRDYPNKPELFILRKVLESRYQVPPGIPPGHIWSGREIDIAMGDVNSIEDVCRLAVANDRLSPEFGYDLFDVGPKISQILANDNERLFGSDQRTGRPERAAALDLYERAARVIARGDYERITGMAVTSEKLSHDVAAVFGLKPGEDHGASKFYRAAEEMIGPLCDQGRPLEEMLTFVMGQFDRMLAATGATGEGRVSAYLFGTIACVKAVIDAVQSRHQGEAPEVPAQRPGRAHDRRRGTIESREARPDSSHIGGGMTDEQKTQAVIKHMVRHVSRGVDSIGGHLEGGRFIKQQLQQELMTAYIQLIDMSAAMHLSDTDHKAVYSFMVSYQRYMSETAGWTSEDTLRFVELCEIRRREYVQ